MRVTVHRGAHLFLASGAARGLVTVKATAPCRFDGYLILAISYGGAFCVSVAACQFCDQQLVLIINRMAGQLAFANEPAVVRGVTGCRNCDYVAGSRGVDSQRRIHQSPSRQTKTALVRMGPAAFWRAGRVHSASLTHSGQPGSCTGHRHDRIAALRRPPPRGTGGLRAVMTHLHSIMPMALCSFPAARCGSTRPNGKTRPARQKSCWPHSNHRCFPLPRWRLKYSALAIRSRKPVT